MLISMRLELQVLEDIDVMLNPDANADREREKHDLRRADDEKKIRRVISSLELERTEKWNRTKRKNGNTEACRMLDNVKSNMIL